MDRTKQMIVFLTLCSLNIPQTSQDNKWLLRGQTQDLVSDNISDLIESVRRSKEAYLRKLNLSRDVEKSEEEKQNDSWNKENKEKWNYLNRNTENRQERKKSNIPTTYLAPPGDFVSVGQNDWAGPLDSKTLNEQTSEKSPRSTLDLLNSKDISNTEKLSNITSIADEIQEIREISYKAKATLNRIREFANITKSNRKCQTASDCQPHQICYLPTNQCKDQLSFFKAKPELDISSSLNLTEREGRQCSLSEDCGDNEVCYQPSQRCVCSLGFIESSGQCKSLRDFNCSDTKNVSKIIDESKWAVQPFCSAWGNNTVHGDKTGLLSYGEYQSGTGTQTDPMLFLGGSDVSCRKQRSCQLVYECYCDEFDCTETSDLAANTTSLWWGEFNPCEYSAFVSTPLACSELIL